MYVAIFVLIYLFALCSVGYGSVISEYIEKCKYFPYLFFGVYSICKLAEQMFFD